MAYYDVRAHILTGGSQGIHPVHSKEYIRIPKTPRPEHHGLIANELVSVQPIPNLPSGMLYYLNYQYKPSYKYIYPDGTIVLTKRNHKPNNKLLL